MIENTSPGSTEKPTFSSAVTPPNLSRMFLDLQERFRRGGAGGLMAPAHVGKSEHRGVARLEQVGAELRALRMRADRIAHVDIHAEPHGPESVADVRPLAALGERGPCLRGDRAVLVVDEEVPARARLADLERRPRRRTPRPLRRPRNVIPEKSTSMVSRSGWNVMRSAIDRSLIGALSLRHRRRPVIGRRQLALAIAAGYGPGRRRWSGRR